MQLYDYLECRTSRLHPLRVAFLLNSSISVRDFLMLVGVAESTRVQSRLGTFLTCISPFHFKSSLRGSFVFGKALSVACSSLSLFSSLIRLCATSPPYAVLPIVAEHPPRMLHYCATTQLQSSSYLSTGPLLLCYCLTVLRRMI